MFSIEHGLHGDLVMDGINANFQFLYGRVFHVEEYGAKADSNGTSGHGTDNAEAFANVAAAVVANGGGVIQLGVGIYRSTGPITAVGSNIAIRGMGMGLSTFFYDSVVNTRNVYLQGNYNLAIDFSVKARRTFTTLGNGIRLIGSHIRILRCGVIDGNCFSIAMSGGAHGRIEGCYVFQSAADGIHVNNMDQFIVKNNLLVECADDAIGIGYEVGATNGIICGNISRYTSTGLSVMGYSPSGTTIGVHSINAYGNVFGDTWLSGMHIHAAQGSISNIKFHGNILRNNGMWVPDAAVNMRGVGIPGGITVLGRMSSAAHILRDITIENNEITGPRNNFIYVGLDTGSGSLGTIEDVKVINNKCKTIGGKGGVGDAAGTGNGDSQSPNPLLYDGIVVANTKNVEVKDNTLNGPLQGFVNVQASCTGVVRVDNNTGIRGNTDNSAANAYQINCTNPATHVSLIHNSNSDAVNAFADPFEIAAGCTVMKDENFTD